jgi:hypothetical protein
MNTLYSKLRELVGVMESGDYHHESSKYADLKKECERIKAEIYHELHCYKDKSEIETIIKSDHDIWYLLPADLAFDVFHQAFILGSLDRDVLIAFACLIYGYGPDWDEESKKIEEYVQENQLEEAVKIAITVKYHSFH